MGLWLLVPAPIRRGLAWLAAGIVVAWGAWVAGKREARQEARTDALRGDAKAHERMSDADIGIGAADSDNMRWLQSFHDKHSR